MRRVTLGIGVEGPSDREFWSKVLPKHFRHASFDVRSMNGCRTLIREAPRLLDMFRDLHYAAGFLLIDYDKVFRDGGSCPVSVLREFDPRVQDEARQPLEKRFLSVCVAVRGVEAWYLADATAIGHVLPRASYAVPPETGDLGGDTLKELWRHQHQRTAFNKIRFAKEMAPLFRPDAARVYSHSFAHFWDRITRAVPP